MDDTSDPADLVVAGIDRTLLLAATWSGWDGRPRSSDDGRLYTPHKAIRRQLHHLVDHLAQVEALLGGHPGRPDAWQASAITTPADLAPFTTDDLGEAEQCLRRLGDLYRWRFAAAGPAEWDAPRRPDWSLREIAQHVGDAWYAEQVGDLTAPATAVDAEA
jgi:hypothetical protein